MSLSRLVLGGALLLGCAAFAFEYQLLLFVMLMLFYPLLDKSWSPPKFQENFQNIRYWVLLLVVTFVCILIKPSIVDAILPTLLFVAIPEEWFFRGYFQTQLIKRLEQYHKGTFRSALLAIVVTSLLFSLIHGVTQSQWFNAALVFLPSVFFGWIFYKSKDIVVLILLHFNGNIIVYSIFNDGLFLDM